MDPISSGAAPKKPPSPPRAFAAATRLKVAHLRLVAAIEEMGSVSAASQAVDLSQPAASRMIAEIEALLKAEVCERLARGVRLTPLGQALARHARSIMLGLEKAEREFEELRAGRLGVVSLGAITAPAFDIAAPALGDIRARAPGVELDVHLDNSTVLARELLASRLDLILARVPDEFDRRDFETEMIGVEQALAVVRYGHPLLARAPVGLPDLVDYEWVMQPRGSPIRRAVDDLFLAAGFEPPRCLVTTTSITFSLMMAARSDVIAVVAQGAAKFAADGPAASGLAILPTDFAVTVQPYSLITVRDRPLSPAARVVYEVIREYATRRDRLGAGANRPR